MKMKISDIDVYECNEAFAAQNLSVIKEMEKVSGEKINRDRWNPNGGAIAFGHPNGASGARVCIFTMKELARSGGRYGMFSSCIGGGLGASTLIENIAEKY
jgi:acetyl-CoA C-acetyltransferase